ncbi:MAG: hypothetical protein H3Z50_01985 [archaeon]|nr:hypothetical protein [archaeon]MCP8306920.1 hypothetical protein [archaeon]
MLGRESAGTGLEAGRVGGIRLVQQEGDEALGGVCGQFRREVISPQELCGTQPGAVFTSSRTMRVHLGI